MLVNFLMEAGVDANATTFAGNAVLCVQLNLDYLNSGCDCSVRVLHHWCMFY